MRAPSMQRLIQILNLSPTQAYVVRMLARLVDDETGLETAIQRCCPRTAAYAASCHSDPFDSPMWRRTMMLAAIDETIGTHGVETLGRVTIDGAPYEYCNAGDPYVPTLIYTKVSDTLRIASWGDIAERMPRDRD